MRVTLSPLFLCVIANKASIVIRLKLVDLSWLFEGETPLSCATLRKKNQTVRFLLENGANLNLVNDKGCSALHYAAIKGLSQSLGKVCAISILA